MTLMVYDEPLRRIGDYAMHKNDLRLFRFAIPDIPLSVERAGCRSPAGVPLHRRHLLKILVINQSELSLRERNSFHLISTAVDAGLNSNTASHVKCAMLCRREINTNGIHFIEDRREFLRP